MGRDKRGIREILSTITIAIMFGVILVLVIFSASGYQKSFNTEEYNGNTRALLSYVITCVKDNNTAEIIVDGAGGEGGLIIRDRDSGYEHRIYADSGRLLEEYTTAGAPSRPEDANLIGRTEVFEVRLLEKGLLEIRTDAGTSYVNTEIGNAG